MSEYKLLVRGASQVVQVCGDGARCVRGENLRHPAVLEGSNEGYSVLVDLCMDTQTEAVTICSEVQTDDSDVKKFEQSCTQTETRTCDFGVQCKRPLLTFDDIKHSDELVSFYTGIPSLEVIEAVLMKLRRKQKPELQVVQKCLERMKLKAMKTLKPMPALYNEELLSLREGQRTEENKSVVESFGSVNTDGPRTNNHLEGWHGRMKKIVSKAHPNVFEMIQFLLDEQKLNELCLVQYQPGQRPPPKKVRYQNNLKQRLTAGAMPLMTDGRIADIDEDDIIRARYKHAVFKSVIDASGKCVMPGLVDAHTHPVWAGDRVDEFALKLAGASYMDVHKAGGGIHFTVECTRQETEDKLYATFRQRLDTMIRFGTTLVECKSGYGLDVDTEIKMLKVIERGRRSGRIDISSTFCGAHAVPNGWDADVYADDVVCTQLPAVERLMRADELHVDNIDVFCEMGVFDVAQSRNILMAGLRAGLQANFHGDELSCLHSAEMGAEIGALAISHLEKISESGIQAMARQGTVAVILPTTAYILRLTKPPVRDMIDSGVVVALGSDFNPNAYCMSMPMVMHLACVQLGMSMTEALCASTINAAAALGKSSTHGSLEVGKVANLLIINSHRWEHLVYKLGCSETVHCVIWHGDVVHTGSHH